VFADAGAPICLLQPPDPYEFYDDPKKGGHTGFEQWPAEDQEIYDEFENDDIGGNLDDYAIPLLPGPEEPDTVLPKLPVSDRPELCPIQDLCNEFSELFNNKIGFCPLVTHDIKTFDEQPMAQRPRRVPHKWQADIRGQIDDMLREGIIRPSMSPWRSPCVYVKKKTGGVRICVDYRELNRRSHMSAYPLPRPDFVQDDLKGARFFTSLDLKSGYWQVPVSAADIPKTAFCPGNGFPLYEFLRMPFGLHDAPATFQKLMEDILGDLPFVKIYLDDILIFSPDMETHVRHLRVVFERLSAAK
ncbi:reverse transcriptase, putative, partial [Perkinsus marinus ATCC 50983]